MNKRLTTYFGVLQREVPYVNNNLQYISCLFSYKVVATSRISNVINTYTFTRPATVRGVKHKRQSFRNQRREHNEIAGNEVQRRKQTKVVHHTCNAYAYE